MADSVLRGTRRWGDGPAEDPVRREAQAREALDVLVISHLCPFPTTHGNRSRLLTLLSWLKERGFRVRFILQPLDVDDGRGIPDLRALVHQLVVVPTGRAGGNAVSKAFQAVKDQLLASRR